ncbi:MAG TPA: lysylphosphatidylglycerol synthase transmembrane domain-containing protein [Pirellulales bacterium]|nr:lysylphosphatidylglycerol synthase transmembrane domain-containing protein [Pirellulales bacterium]
MTQPTSGRRRLPIALLFKFGVVLLLVWGVHRTVESALVDLEEHHWSPASLRPGWLIASAVLYLAGLLPSGVFWWRVLLALGQTPRLPETLRAYYIGHLGKYVPGKALVIILRTGLIRSTRVDTAVAVVSVFYETLTMMAVGACVGGLLSAIWFRHESWLLLVALGMAAAAGIPTLPPVFRRIVLVAGRRKVDPEALDRIAQIRPRAYVLGWLGIAAGWTLNGISLWAILVAAGFIEPTETIDTTLLDQILISVAAGALANVAGFLSLIPGGAVVREAVLIALLAPMFGQAGAVVSAIVARIVSLVAEILISAILYVSGPRRSQQ